MQWSVKRWLGTAMATACLCAPAVQAQEPARRLTWRERTAPYRAAITHAATANQARPAAERLAGDALLDAYLRAGADRLRSRIADLDAVEARRARRDEIRAWCVAMAVSLDRTSMLATHPLARLTLGEVETETQRADRLKVLGDPSLRTRSDWARHFWVSVGIRALLGRAIAESVGIQKEFEDARRLSQSGAGEGFSLPDLCADVAGIELTERLLAGDATVDPLVGRLAEQGRHTDWMPQVSDLASGLDGAAAAARFGRAGDSRMQRALADLRLRVQSTPGHAACTSDE